MTALKLSPPARSQFLGSNFRLIFPQAINLLRSGDHQAVDLGDALWACDVDTTDLSLAQGGSYKWLLARLRVIGSLYLFDNERLCPLAYYPYVAGASPWGSPMVAAVHQDTSTIDCTGFAPGAIISAGDYGHWDDGPVRMLHICGPAVADASGNATISVEPPPPPSATATLPVPFVMEKASCEMTLTAAKLPFDAASRTQKLSLSGVQAIRRT